MKKISNILFQYISVSFLIVILMGGGVAYLVYDSLQTKKAMHLGHQKDILASAKLITPLLDQTVEKASDLLEVSATYIKTHKKSINFMGEQCFIQMQALLETQMIGKDWVGNFLIRDTKGEVRFQFEKNGEPDRKLLRHSGDSGLEITTPPHHLRPFNPHDLILSLPLYDGEGTFVGESILSIRYSYLQELLVPNLQEGVTGLGLFSSQGTTLAIVYADYTHRSQMIGQPISSLTPFAHLPDLSYQTAGEYWIDEQEGSFLIESLSSMPAFLVVLPDQKFIKQRWQEESFFPTLYAVILIVIATLIAIIVLFFQAKQTLRSFAKLNRQVHESLQEIRQKDQIIQEQSKRRAMNDLLVDLAHHWRQPLNTATIAVQNIEDHLPQCRDPEAILRYINIVVKELTDLSHTISRFSQFYDREAFHPLNIHKGLELVRSLSGSAWRAKEITVQADLPKELHLSAGADEWVDLFSGMIMNVHEVQKSRNIGAVTIHIQAVENPNGITLIFRDNAGGIDETLLPEKLFDPYVTTFYKSRDKGLGLYTIRNIITYSLRGTITAQNTPDGAQFTIKIPQQAPGKPL